jgi:hypothetical protein
MSDTGGMRRPSRLKQPRLLRRDWIGDGILTLIAGSVLVIAVFLPWANEDKPGQVNYSLSMPDGINGILRTQWGTPALVLAIAVVILAVVMTLTTPRRFSFVLGLLVAACGVAVVGVGRDAAAGLGWWSPGLGMYLTVLAGVLLVPIGIAATLVAWILARAEGRASEDPPAPQSPPSTTPPAPESAPPS